MPVAGYRPPLPQNVKLALKVVALAILLTVLALVMSALDPTRLP